jgi:molecular chaperone GrpE
VTEHRRKQPRGTAGGDDVADAAASSPTAERQQEQVERDITELLADVERERDEYLELARRTKADFENYRKRVAGEAAEAEKRGRAALVRELLPVLDNLERALAAAVSGGTQAGERTTEETLADGVRLVREELASILRRSGVESYEPAGERFDPHWHEAMMTRPARSEDAGKVLEVLEKGYRLDGQVLRPARVVVGEEKGPSAGKPPAGSEAGRQPPTGSQSGRPPADGSEAGPEPPDGAQVG